jgi:site-specific DNA-methyltransferase (adenine-specific)
MYNLQNKSIDSIITDLPYNIVNSFGEQRSKYLGQIRKINKKNADILNFDLQKFLNEISRIAKGSVYLFCGYNQLSQIFMHFRNDKDFMVRVCYWHKSNPSPMNGQHFYLNATEPIIFAKRRKTRFNPNCKHNIFEHPSIRSKLHPTEKPIELLMEFIKDSTIIGDLVADFCAGSFSTAAACIRTQRRFLGTELNNEYFEIGKNRIIEESNEQIKK